MTRGIALYGVASILIACGSTASTPSEHLAPYVASAACPLKSPSDWQTFLVDFANRESWGITCSDLGNCQELVGEFATDVQQRLLGTLEQCSADLRDNPAIARCADRFARFAPAWLAQHDQTSYGFKQLTHEYLLAQTERDTPEGMMDLPSEVVAAWPSRAKLEQLAQERGWPYLEHASCLGGTRFFLTREDPAGRFDQWFTFGFDPAAAELPVTDIVSFIAVQKREATGQILAQVRVHFRDYFVTTDSGTPQISLPEESGGKCYACHASGLRQLAPFAGGALTSAPVAGEAEFGAPVAADFGQRRRRDFDRRLAAYGLPDWHGALAPEDHGPPLGANLGCPGCHDGKLRGALSIFTSEGQLQQKVLEQLSMRSAQQGQVVPDEAAMTLLERSKTDAPPLSQAEAATLEAARQAHALDYQMLVDARMTDLRVWLLERACN